MWWGEVNCHVRPVDECLKWDGTRQHYETQAVYVPELLIMLKKTNYALQFLSGNNGTWRDEWPRKAEPDLRNWGFSSQQESSRCRHPVYDVWPVNHASCWSDISPLSRLTTDEISAQQLLRGKHWEIVEVLCQGFHVKKNRFDPDLRRRTFSCDLMRKRSFDVYFFFYKNAEILLSYTLLNWLYWH